MSERNKASNPAATFKIPLPSASATTSRGKITKEKIVRSKNANTTVNDCNTTIIKEPDFADLNLRVAYGKLLRSRLEDCLLDEKIEREETGVDLQMAQLASRFAETMDLMSKTNLRLKDISFVVEQKRLLDLKSTDCSQLYEATSASNSQHLLKDLCDAEVAFHDRLELKNVDFGYDKQSGHKQLLNAVDEAIDGLEEIKKHCNIDLSKLIEYEKSEKYVKDIEKDISDYLKLSNVFEYKFSKVNEKLVKEASDITTMMIKEHDDDNND